MRVQVNHGIRLGYDMSGTGSQTLVLLHAFPLQRRMWEAQAASLAASGAARVVTVDLRGFGESDVVPGPATMEQMAEDVRGLLDALGLEQVALCGLSMGGYVAFACMRSFSDRVHGLILADTRATADTEQGHANRETSARLAEEQGVVALFDRDVPKLFGSVTLHDRPDVVALGREVAAANLPEGVAAASRGMGLRPDSIELLPQIACPTLVIVGEQDALTPLADARMLFERIPNAQLEVITDAGHLSNLERPDVFTEHVARFLRETVTPAR